ncbi:GNAT family N-acetyltransferase [Bordetella bronchialis]|uniref:GNAT family N-acetyltransferase n=1 Tax=Bordetella bronchialis TaxID=463025 RepID=UPI003CFD7896
MGGIAGFPHEGEVHIDVARQADVARIRGMVVNAYSKYIERIGKEPAPMHANYEALVDEGKIFVLRRGTDMLGSIQIVQDGDAVSVNNLCVAPDMQGKGYGRLLMEYAEQVARERKLSAVELYTNEKMHENIALYGKLGFVETGRKTQDGFARVYFRKQVG